MYEKYMHVWNKWYLFVECCTQHTEIGSNAKHLRYHFWLVFLSFSSLHHKTLSIQKCCFYTLTNYFLSPLDVDRSLYGHQPPPTHKEISLLHKINLIWDLRKRRNWERMEEKCWTKNGSNIQNWAENWLCWDSRNCNVLSKNWGLSWVENLNTLMRFLDVEILQILRTLRFSKQLQRTQYSWESVL